jgi:hypothetical protein
VSEFPGFASFGSEAWRSERVVIYGYIDIWHDTADDDRPLCWGYGMATVSEPMPHAPTWPHLIARGDALDRGLRQCFRCRRNLGWGVGYIKSLI